MSCVSPERARAMTTEHSAVTPPTSATSAMIPTSERAALTASQRMAAVLANGGGFYHPFAYVAEAMRMGLTVLPPDVNASDVRTTGRGREVRIGLQFVKGLSAEGVERILEARDGRADGRTDGRAEGAAEARVCHPERTRGILPGNGSSTAAPPVPSAPSSTSSTAPTSRPTTCARSSRSARWTPSRTGGPGR